MSHAPNTPILTIEDGIHASAVWEIRRGETAVGTAPTGTVVVSDLSADTAFRVHWDGHRMRLCAVGCEAVVAGRPLECGSSLRLERSTRFVSGGIPFHLDLPPVRFGWSARLARLPKGFGAGLLTASVAALVAGSTWPPANLPILPTTTPAEPALVTPPAPAERTKRVEHDLPAALRERLAAVGLDEIVVEPQSDGAIAASGRVGPDKGEAWRGIVRWFDTAAEGRAVLIDRVVVAAATTALQIRAAYTGPIPYVIDGAGEKLFVGSVLADGSVLRKVEGRRVILERGGRTLAVRF